MSLSTLLIEKELSQGHQPLLLASFQMFGDGTESFGVSSQNLTYGSPSLVYSGFLLNQNVAVTAAMTQGGIDVSPAVTLKLSDIEKSFWSLEDAVGFKGTIVTLRLIFADLNTTTNITSFSSDSKVIFVGTCDSANSDDDSITITATSTLNLQKTNLPQIKLQKRTPYAFPDTLADRTAALNDSSSPFYACGYSPDVSGGFGNYKTGTTPFTSADFDGTWENYLLMLGSGTNPGADLLGRQTGTWAGCRFQGPNSFTGKQYTSGNTVRGQNVLINLSNAWVPIIWGEAPINPLVTSQYSEPNSTRGECILSLGQVNLISGNQITCNNVFLNGSSDIGTGVNIKVIDPLVCYDVVTNGSRHGRSNTGWPWNGVGDTWGGIAVISYVCYNTIQDSTSVPTLRAVVQGRKVHTFNSGDPTDFGINFSDNYAWVIADCLNMCGVPFAALDLNSFRAAAAYYDTIVSFKDVNGVTSTQKLYSCSLALIERKNASDIIRGLRQACRSMLVPNSSNAGLLALIPMMPLGDQQPSPIAGSNYNTPVVSVDGNGTTKNGYVAYRFSDAGDDTGSILREKGKSTLTISQESILASGNALSFTFNDSNNVYVTDNYSVSDSRDQQRSGQIVNQNDILPLGVSSFSHAQRIGASLLAQRNNGNNRNDTGGTMTVTLKSSVKCMHLQIGNIVLVNSPRNSLIEQPFRVTKIQPSMDWASVTLSMSYHVDDWYLFNFGTSGYISHSGPRSESTNRPPFPWLPNIVSGSISDPLYGPTNSTFGVVQKYEVDAASLPQVSLVVTGNQPITVFGDSHPPILRNGYSTSASGGKLPANHLFSFCVCAIDSNGLYSAPSNTLVVPLAATGVDTYTATLTNIVWAANTSSYALFGGIDPNKMCWQKTGTGIPSTISLNTYNEQSFGCPDTNVSKLRVKLKRSIHAGVTGLAITGTIDDTSIQITGETFTVNQWVGRIVSVLGNSIADGELKVLNWTIDSNTADTLTVHVPSGGLGPGSSGVNNGDVIIIRTLADTFSTTTIGDSMFVSADNPSGLNVNEEVGRRVRIIAGTGAGQSASIKSNTSTVLTIDGVFAIVPSSDSVFIVEESSWLASYDTTTILNSLSASPISIPCRIDNFLNSVLLVEVGSLDSNGNESIEQKNVWREISVYGIQSAATVGDNYTTIFADATGHIAIDLANGFKQRLVLTDPTDGTVISNPSFEAGLTDWTSTSGVSSSSVVTTFAHDGTSSLAQDVGTGSTVQDVGCTLGSFYVISAWVKTDAGAAASAFLSVSEPGGAGLISSSTVTDTDWTNLQVFYNATASTFRVSLNRVAGSGNVYWDDLFTTRRFLVDAPIYSGGTVSSSLPPLKVYLDQDATGNQNPPTFNGGSGGFASDTGSVSVDGTPHTRTFIQFTYHPEDIWGVDYSRTGGAIS